MDLMVIKRVLLMKKSPMETMINTPTDDNDNDNNNDDNLPSSEMKKFDCNSDL